MKRSCQPIIGITLGDPQGIGPEVIEKALASPLIKRICRPVVFGDAEFFDLRRARRLTPRECGALSAFYIRQATEAAISGQMDALVTAPISKERLNLAGYRYPGHTELLAKLTGTREIRMMMAGPKLKVVLETIHLPLKKVPTSFDANSLRKTIELTNTFFKKWLCIKPRIAVAGLNPHAGEAGIFGREETKIGAAVKSSRKKGIKVFGPFSPDTIFYRAMNGEFDVVIALYHDQGLIPFKLLHFRDGVNMTLGLPFVRTSPDHGTAFDIAGKGVADPTSLIEAIKMATALTRT